MSSSEAAPSHEDEIRKQLKTVSKSLYNWRAELRSLREGGATRKQVQLSAEARAQKCAQLESKIAEKEGEQEHLQDSLRKGVKAEPADVPIKAEQVVKAELAEVPIKAEPTDDILMAEPVQVPVNAQATEVPIKVELELVKAEPVDIPMEPVQVPVKAEPLDDDTFQLWFERLLRSAEELQNSEELQGRGVTLEQCILKVMRGMDAPEKVLGLEGSWTDDLRQALPIFEPPADVWAPRVSPETKTAYVEGLEAFVRKELARQSRQKEIEEAGRESVRVLRDAGEPLVWRLRDCHVQCASAAQEQMWQQLSRKLHDLRAWGQNTSRVCVPS